MTNHGIEWLNRPGTKGQSWNPVRGCTRVSEGCTNCYAERMAARYSKRGMWGCGFAEMTPGGPRWTGRVELIEHKIDEPLHWRKPRTVFVNSTSDLFHEKLPDEAIDRVFAVMALCPGHTFIVLTKRPERMREYFAGIDDNDGGRMEGMRDALIEGNAQKSHADRTGEDPSMWLAVHTPLSNVWLGTSVEDQATAEARIPALLETPAAVRFVSYEPALGPVDLSPWVWDRRAEVRHLVHGPAMLNSDQADAAVSYPLDWIICGGESGPGARGFDLGWARSVVRQCKAAEVPCFVKQIGAHPYETMGSTFGGYDPDDLSSVMTKAREQPSPPGWTRVHVDGESKLYRYWNNLRDRKGGNWDEWPDDLRIREWPA